MREFLATVKAAMASIFRMESDVSEMLKSLSDMSKKLDKILTEQRNREPAPMTADEAAARNEVTAKLEELDRLTPDTPEPPVS
jgi:hypothetical protein